MDYTLEQYWKDTQRTYPDLGNDSTNFIHMVSGICTEIDEFNKATDTINAKEELGDTMWYVSNLYPLLEVRPITKRELEESYKMFSGFDYVSSSLYLLDKAKKYLAYGETIHRPMIVTHLNVLVFNIRSLFDSHEDFLHTLELNINKLKGRYPDKFEADKAINRNLDKERAILEAKK